MSTEKPDETECVQIVISGVPADLLKDIDALAAADERPRANYIRRLLAEIVESKKQALQPA